MKVSFEGIGEMVATFACQDGVAAGNVVKLTGSGQVGQCSAGDDFFGVAVSKKAGFAGIQFAGLTQISYSGTAPGCGWVKLKADGSGNVAVATTGGRDYLVIAVDGTAKTAVVRL